MRGKNSRCNRMEFSTVQTAPEKVKTACLVVTVFEGGGLSSAALSVDKASGGRIRALISSGDVQGKLGTTRLLYGLPRVAADRVLVLGLGKEPAPHEFRDAVRAATAAVNELGLTEACFFLVETTVKGSNTIWRARQMAIAAADATYRFDQMKSIKPERELLQNLSAGLTGQTAKADCLRGLAQGKSIAAGMAVAKDLANLPGNVCTPTYLAKAATALGKEHKLAVEVLERKDMERLGMGALLSVAKGSREVPKLIVIRHGGGGKKPPVVLVGKGITFDTGGISIKPAGEMDEMKFDMCGAASVLGALKAAAVMDLKLNVIGIIPAAENMPGGAASKPGDIVTSMSGQTVEILNTDAEGRLILCDALTYAERFKPQAVIDIATLTGACIIALGHVCSGLFSNREELSREMVAAGLDAWDRVWPMPLWDDYQDQLKSNFADFANIGGRPAGSVTAACFLSRFTKHFDWAHLDIAGTAWRSGKDKGATGRPVPLLMAFLMSRAARSPG